MAERDTRFGGNLETANTRPTRMSNQPIGWHRMSNQPRPDSMNMDRMYQQPDNLYYDQDQDWGIMAFNDPDVNQMKDDYFGHRFLDTAWGRATLGQWAKKFGLGPESAQNLEDAIGGGGFSAFGGTISPNVGIGDDSWSLGFTGKWNL